MSTTVIDPQALTGSPNLDPGLYSLKPNESLFLKQLTNIDDDEKLKEHVLAVQAEAYRIFPYPCIHGFRFLNLKISMYPCYKDVLALGRNRKGAILLDMACCFGNDARKAAADGFPESQILASDIEQGFWDLGHKLFKSEPNDFPIQFVPGDIFDENFISIIVPSSEDSSGGVNYPEIKSLGLANSLNPLLGKISAIHASSFFHLFDEEQQTVVARKLANLLSPESGSIIFGSHGGSRVKGMHTAELGGSIYSSFCHSPESFKELWETNIFNKGEVVCDASVVDFGKDRLLLLWSVKRV